MNLRQHIRVSGIRCQASGSGLRLAPSWRVGNHASRITHHVIAFTLIELLVVIAIIGILALIVGPVLANFRKGDAMLSATRTMLDGVGRARQLAISQHTTVFMVFIPTNFWMQPIVFDNAPNLVLADKQAATNLLDKQLTGFGFISLRSIGDQPGQGVARYLGEWRSLPEKSFIAQWKFNGVNQSNIITDAISGQTFLVRGFQVTNLFPFPREDTKPRFTTGLKYVQLPYIAFDYQGRLVSADGQLLGRDEYIPLAHGSVTPAVNPVTRRPEFLPAPAGNPSVVEQAPGNSRSTAYNLIHIDWLTGRARLERQQVQ